MVERLDFLHEYIIHRSSNHIFHYVSVGDERKRVQQMRLPFASSLSPHERYQTSYLTTRPVLPSLQPQTAIEDICGSNYDIVVVDFDAANYLKRPHRLNQRSPVALAHSHPPSFIFFAFGFDYRNEGNL